SLHPCLEVQRQIGPSYNLSGLFIRECNANKTVAALDSTALFG
ncbi:unnamed protein product, partial [marine sediment metagenome]